MNGKPIPHLRTTFVDNIKTVYDTFAASKNICQAFTAVVRLNYIQFSNFRTKYHQHTGYGKEQ